MKRCLWTRIVVLLILMTAGLYIYNQQRIMLFRVQQLEKRVERYAHMVHDHKEISSMPESPLSRLFNYVEEDLRHGRPFADSLQACMHMLPKEGMAIAEKLEPFVEGVPTVEQLALMLFMIEGDSKPFFEEGHWYSFLNTVMKITEEPPKTHDFINAIFHGNESIVMAHKDQIPIVWQKMFRQRVAVMQYARELRQYVRGQSSV